MFLLGGLLGVLAVLLAGEPCPAVFATAPLRARRVNLTRVAVASLVGPAILTALGPGDWLATTQTTIVVAGEGCVAASALGLRLAWLPPLLHLSAAGSFGAATREELHPWAWLISAEPTTGGLVFSLCVWIGGLALWWVMMTRRSDALST